MIFLSVSIVISRDITPLGRFSSRAVSNFYFFFISASEVEKETQLMIYVDTSVVRCCVSGSMFSFNEQPIVVSFIILMDGS